MTDIFSKPTPDPFDRLDQTPAEDLPDEIRQLLEELKIERDQKREALGKEVSKLRKAAIAGRKQSGIEEIIKEDEEYTSALMMQTGQARHG